MEGSCAGVQATGLIERGLYRWLGQRVRVVLIAHAIAVDARIKGGYGGFVVMSVFVGVHALRIERVHIIGIIMTTRTATAAATATRLRVVFADSCEGGVVSNTRHEG